jgi:hypothetical protein
MPSEAASVASRMRTGESCGEAWNAALIGSRSSWVHPAVKQAETLAAEAVAGEDLVHPLVRGAVLGEQDHPRDRSTRRRS